MAGVSSASADERYWGVYDVSVGADINGDGVGDVLAHVRTPGLYVQAIDGRTGAVIWEAYGLAALPRASYDLTGDGVVDLSRRSGPYLQTDSIGKPLYRWLKEFAVDAVSGAVLWDRDIRYDPPIGYNPSERGYVDADWRHTTLLGTDADGDGAPESVRFDAAMRQVSAYGPTGGAWPMSFDRSYTSLGADGSQTLLETTISSTSPAVADGIGDIDGDGLQEVVQIEDHSLPSDQCGGPCAGVAAPRRSLRVLDGDGWTTRWERDAPSVPSNPYEYRNWDGQFLATSVRSVGGDLDGDGIDELCMTYNRFDGAAEVVSGADGVALFSGWCEHLHVVGDVDGDARPDIAAVSTEEVDGVSVVRIDRIRGHDGASLGTLEVEVPQGGTPRWGVGDVDGDGLDDVVLEGAGWPSRAHTLVGGDGTLLHAAPEGAALAVLADVDGDGRSEVAVRDDEAQTLAVRTLAGEALWATEPWEGSDFVHRYNGLWGAPDADGDGLAEVLEVRTGPEDESGYVTWLTMRDGGTGAVLWQRGGPGPVS